MWSEGYRTLVKASQQFKSQSEFARSHGLDPVAVNRFLAGLRPGLKWRKRFRDALGIGLEDWDIPPKEHAA